ncbi:MAG: thioredoxin fold domain-containing protein [bacterium]
MKKWARAKALWIGAIALILAGSLSFWGSPPPGAKTTSGVKWHAYEEGAKKARESNRPIVLHFYTEWCTWCKKMDGETFANPRIEEFLNLSFIPIKINGESREMIKVEGKETKMADLARKFGVRGFPTTVFLESNGTTIGSVPGYIDQDRMRKILVYVHEKAYKKMDFEEFTRQRSEFRATGH